MSTRIGLGVTAAAVMLLAWHFWPLIGATERLRVDEHRLMQLTGKILYLDEVLTMSARMAVATLDPAWEGRYRQFEPQLDEAIKESSQLDPEVTGGFVSQTAAANRSLVEMENQAFELVRRKDQRAASAILFSPEYETQKQLYTEGMRQLATTVDARAQAALDMHQQQMVIAFAGFLCMPAALSVLWLALLRTTAGQARAERLARQAMEQAQGELQGQVAKATADLTATNHHLEEEMDLGMQQREQLQANSVFLQALIDAIPTPIFVEDTGGAHRLVNDAHAQSFNLPKSEILGKTVRDIHGPEFAHIHDEQDRLLLETGGTATYEAELANPDGSIRHMLVSKACMLAANGRATGLVGVVFDITERKRIEQNLKAGEARYRGVFDLANDAILLIEDGIVIDCNAKAQESFGCSREQLLGRELSDFSPPHQPDGRDLREDAAAQMKAALAGREARFEWQHRRADGTTFDAEVRLSRMDIGDATVVQAIVRDLSQSKRIQTALEASEERLRTIFEASPVAIISLAPGGVVTSWNAAAEQIFGYDASEVIGRQLPTVRPEDGVEARQFYEWVLAGATLQGLEVNRRRKDGTLVDISLSMAPLRNSAGVPIGIMAALIDITEHRRADAAIRDSEARFSTVFHCSPVLIAITRLSDSRIVDVNEAWQTVTGLSREEAVGRTASELNCWVDTGDRERLIGELGANGSVRDFQFQLRHQSGAVSDMLMSARLVDVAGEPCMLSMAQDITKAKKAEAALRESEMRFRSLAQATSQIIWTTDGQGQVRGPMPSWQAYTGQSDEEIQGSGWSGALHPEDVERAIGVWNEAVRNRSGYEVEYRMRGQDGVYRHFVARGAPVMGADGGIHEWVGTCTDINERKEAQEALRDSDSKYRLLHESMTDAFGKTDMAGRILESNRAFREMLGYAEEELQHLTYIELTPPKWREMEAKIVHEQIIPSGSSGIYEKECIRKDGSVFPVELRTFLIRDENGQPAEMWAIVRDITERKLAQSAAEAAAAELRQQKELLSTIVDHIPAYVFWKDRQSVYLGCGNTFARSAGVASPQDIVGKTDFDLAWTRAQALTYREGDQRVMEGGQAILNVEETQRTADGANLTVQTSKVPLRNPQGDVVGVLGIYADVTGRKCMEQALRRSQQFFKAVLNSLSTHIAILDEKGTIIEVNDAWRSFADQNGLCTPAHGVGMNYLAVCEAAHGEDAAVAGTVMEGIRQVLQGKRESFHVDYPCHGPADQRWFMMRVTRFAGEGALRAVVAHLDVTERKLAEDSRARGVLLEHERNSLRDSVTALEQVIGVVGHELRTPLAGLRAISELLLDPDDLNQEATSRFLGNINSEVIRLADMVNNMLEVTRISSGVARWQWGQVDLMEACTDAVETVRPLIDAARVSLSCDVDPAGLAMRGDADAIRRLVLNLVSNSQKHTVEGRITVQVRSAGGVSGTSVRIDISDTGEGIPPDIACKLGEPFALNSGVTGGSHVKGSGLGLAICRGIVAAHGGSLRVKSSPGEGTTVVVLLRADLDGPAPLKDVEISQEACS